MTKQIVGIRTHEIKKICKGLAPADYDDRFACIADTELRQSLEFIKKFENIVTFLGSARIKEGTKYYEAARTLAARLVTEHGFAIASGGGPGIMEAANRGAYEAGGKSLGMTIALAHEQHTNKYVTDEMNFQYFFTRKVVMSFSARGYVYFPGGYGTMDELFEFLTLIQTKKMPATPVFLYGTDFWAPISAFIQQTLEEQDLISEWDDHLFVITDDLDEIIQGIVRFNDEESL